MSLINGALQIGRSAINASQGALTVTGNNMANAATESYSRQNVQLAATQYQRVAPGKYTGTGVALYDVRRQVDDALNNRLRLAVGDSASYLIQQQTMTRVESVFNELTDEDLSTRLNAFFDSWSNLQTQPGESSTRSVVLQEGQSLANFIHEMRGDLSQIQGDLDAQVRYQVAEASDLAAQAAALNQQVVLAEAGQAGSAAALRDQRDEILKQLGELVNISTHEMDGGAMNVYIGNDPVVEYSQSKELKYLSKETSPGSGDYLAQVVFGNNNQAVSLTSGKINGLITARDDQVGGVIEKLDSWAKSLIYEVNKEHSMGEGLTGYSSLTSTNTVEDTTASLAAMNTTNLPWTVKNGTFEVKVKDTATGLVKTSTIAVQIGIDGSDTTLASLASDLDAVANLSASIDAGGHLVLSSDANFTFSFSAPSSGDATDALAVLGINTYFTGKSAYDINVSSTLKSDQSKIGASATGEPINGAVAGAIAALGITEVDSMNGQSVSEFFTSMVGQIAAESKAAQDNYAAADVVVQTLESERQSISGVSLDEEAIHMIMFQRAFQGASRYVNVVDQMLDEILNLVRY